MLIILSLCVTEMNGDEMKEKGLYSLTDDSYFLLHFINLAWGFFKEQREDLRRSLQELQEVSKDRRRMDRVNKLFPALLYRRLRQAVSETKKMQRSGFARWIKKFSRELNLSLPSDKWPPPMKGNFPPQVWRTLPPGLRDRPVDMPYVPWLPWLPSLLEVRILFLFIKLPSMKTRPDKGLARDFYDLLAAYYGKYDKPGKLIDLEKTLQASKIQARKRLDTIPFCLTEDLRLIPKWDKPEEDSMIWACAAQCLVDIKAIGFDRLKTCSFPEGEGVLCANILWDESKNKVRKYCDENDCIKARQRSRVSAFRKKGG